MVQLREISKTMVVSQKIEHPPWAWEAAWTAANLVADAAEIGGKPARLQVGPTYIPDMYDGVLT